MEPIKESLSNYSTIISYVYYAIAALGAAFVLHRLFIIIRGLFRLIFRRRQNLTKVYGEKSWVLVTGSSQGIGKQFALQFAEAGFNIILLARTQSKLKAVKQQILSLFPSTEVEIVTADLISEGKKQNIEDVLPQLNKFKNISIIVNNAGMDVLSKYTELKTQNAVDLLSINCFALAAVCYKYIPYFENRMKETGNKCGFINVGSIAGEIPIPLFNVYSASKGYVIHLTNNLSKEYPHINWMVLNPGGVTTAMTGFRNDILSASTKQCVSGSLRDFGYDIKTNGALSHKIQSFLYNVVPSWLFNVIWYNIIGPEHIKFRQNYKKSQ